MKCPKCGKELTVSALKGMYYCENCCTESNMAVEMLNQRDKADKLEKIIEDIRGKVDLIDRVMEPHKGHYGEFFRQLKLIIDKVKEA